MSSDQNPGYIQMIILLSCIETIRSHCKYPYDPVRIMECHKIFEGCLPDNSIQLHGLCSAFPRCFNYAAPISPPVTVVTGRNWQTHQDKHTHTHTHTHTHNTNLSPLKKNKKQPLTIGNSKKLHVAKIVTVTYIAPSKTSILTPNIEVSKMLFLSKKWDFQLTDRRSMQVLTDAKAKAQEVARKAMFFFQVFFRHGYHRTEKTHIHQKGEAHVFGCIYIHIYIYSTI